MFSFIMHQSTSFLGDIRIKGDCSCVECKESSCQRHCQHCGRGISNIICFHLHQRKRHGQCTKNMFAFRHFISFFLHYIMIAKILTSKGRSDGAWKRRFLQKVCGFFCQLCCAFSWISFPWFRLQMMSSLFISGCLSSKIIGS